MFNIPIFQNTLTSSRVYKFTFYFTTMDNAESEFILTSQTKDSPGGYGYFNITFASDIPKS